MEDATRGDDMAPESTFEDVLRELESIVETLENDPPPLEAALEAYERGVHLARACMSRLQTAELRIQELGLE
jgi:exodeoxyribonuclease VII small subunit